jgi:hypothetical protein
MLSDMLLPHRRARLCTAMTFKTLSIDIALPLRGSGARRDPAPWLETEPACFRSEAFAEDLLELALQPARHNPASCDTPASFSLRNWSWLRPRSA